ETGARLKTHVFVLVPYAVGPSAILEFAEGLLARHRMDGDDRSRGGRFDYLVGFDGYFSDTVAEGRLPAKVLRVLHRHICEMQHLPDDLVPGALVTPDGIWHDLEDHGWRMVDQGKTSNLEAQARWSGRYRELIAEHPHCWVVEYWARS